MNEAITSLPLPDSPVIKTFESVRLTRSARLIASRIPGERAKTSITIRISKTFHYRCRIQAATRRVLIPATTVRDRKTVAPSVRTHVRRSRRNRAGSIRQSYNPRLLLLFHPTSLIARRPRRKSLALAARSEEHTSEL